VLAGTVLLAGLGAAAFLTRNHWLGRLRATAGTTGEGPRLPLEEARVLKLSPQARQNLKLVSRPVALQTYWRTIQVPGVVVDRPAHSDRGVTAPVAGVVVRVAAVPGDTVRPGGELLTLRLTSETLQSSQTELYKAAEELRINAATHKRLGELYRQGNTSEAVMRNLRYQAERLGATRRAYRHDLAARGLTPEQIDQVEQGRFLKEIVVRASLRRPGGTGPSTTPPSPGSPGTSRDGAPLLEVEELKVQLGQQVQAGQMLCLLADHHALSIEGRGFRREAPLVERAARKGWPVRVEFAEDDRDWPPLAQTFHIHHLANTIDRATRTFGFYLPLANQSRSCEKDGRTFLLWRFRPGQRVRLYVPVEEFRDVLVLPAGAVAREGPEAYVFRQNGDLFDRRPVHVLYEDRLNVVLANDGSVAPGWYVAHNAAALNRVLKAQNSSGGLPPGFHVHPDGTMHGPH
jgi:biotin carboxyl carrier protein